MYNSKMSSNLSPALESFTVMLEALNRISIPQKIKIVYCFYKKSFEKFFCKLTIVMKQIKKQFSEKVLAVLRILFYNEDCNQIKKAAAQPMLAHRLGLRR